MGSRSPSETRIMGPVSENPAGDVTSESTTTVLVAAAVNLTIAVAKAVGALVSGSAAMLSEAAHSVADTVTEVLLFIAVRRGSRPADVRHPFGHGREFYLWALLAALSLFVAGACVSILEGIQKIVTGEHEGSPLVAYLVLAVAFVLESVSLTRALVQVKEGAARWDLHPRTFFRVTTDTAVKAVTVEDIAALVGLLLAAGGLALTEATGSPVWDGLASILIGTVLLGVAVTLARVNSALLIGRAADPALQRRMLDELRAMPAVVDVPMLVTSVLGPEQLLVAARVRFTADCTADEIARVADEAERRFIAIHPGVREVFLDPTPRHVDDVRPAGRGSDTPREAESIRSAEGRGQPT
jgi:cation diffusion facilitator family transporter